MNKPVFFSFVLCLLLFSTPQWGSAQIMDRPVALMTFVGDDMNISAWIQTGVIREVAALEGGGYTTRQISAAQFPETINLPADLPPDQSYLENDRFVLTGEYYVDMDDLQHFQMWLWISDTGALVYTDEMVFEDNEEAETYLAPMVRWIFSHVMQDQIINVVGPQIWTEIDTASDRNEDGIPDNTGEGKPPLFMGRLHLGVRGGASFNVYQTQVSGGYEAGMSQGLSAHGVFLVSFKIFRYLGLQAEAVFNYDTFKVAMITDKPSATPGLIDSVRSTDRFSYMSLMFPLLFKIPLDIGKFTVSPFVGVYYILPLGKLSSSPDDVNSGRTNRSYNYTINPPLGLLLGIDAGYALGPGELFLDLRYNRDIGMVVAERGTGIQYVRNQIGLSLGYKFLIWDRQRRQPAN